MKTKQRKKKIHCYIEYNIVPFVVSSLSAKKRMETQKEKKRMRITPNAFKILGKKNNRHFQHHQHHHKRCAMCCCSRIEKNLEQTA